MGIKAQWITIILILFAFLGIVFSWKVTYHEYTEITGNQSKQQIEPIFGYTPDSIKHKKYNSIKEAADEFATTYFKDQSVDSYKVYYVQNEKFEKEGHIPAILAYTEKDDYDDSKIFYISPFYINEKKDKFTVTSYALVGISSNVKESSKYEVFTQPLKNYKYDFIASKDKKNVLDSDAILYINEKKIYVGINSYVNSN